MTSRSADGPRGGYVQGLSGPRSAPPSLPAEPSRPNMKQNEAGPLSVPASNIAMFSSHAYHILPPANNLIHVIREAGFSP